MIKFYLTTYTNYSDKVAARILDNMQVKYTWKLIETEESYSKFEVQANREQFETIRELTKDNNGAAISIEFGTN